MQRPDDIRSVVHTLLASPKRPEMPFQAADGGPASTGALSLSDTQANALRDLQNTLYENGIDTNASEIAQALLHALVRRPALCRGLLAAYLTEA